MYKKVLITGGSGFVGRRIIEECQKLGYETLSPRSSEMDLFSFDSVFEYLEAHEPDAIIHSAAYYGGIAICDNEPADLFDKNARMTIALYKAAAESSSVDKVVAVGSACAYPALVDGNMSEDDFWNGELHDTVEAYGSSKKIQLIAQNAYYKQNGLKGNHLVLTNLYGENDVFTEYRSHVVAALIKRFSDEIEKGSKEIINWGDGTPVREFMYVGDAAKALALSVSLDHDLKPINIGTGIGTSIKELAEAVADNLNFKGELKWDVSKPNGVARKVLDVKRMKSIFPDFKPYSFKEGLSHTVDWYLKNKETADSRK
jgi:GDP-L-fucose synthase